MMADHEAVGTIDISTSISKLVLNGDDELKQESQSKKISVDSGITSQSSGDTTEDNLGEDEVDHFYTKSNESSTLQLFFSKLLIAMEPDVFSLASGLFSARLIESETKNRVLDTSQLSDREKCARVLKDIEHKVLLNPPVLVDFLEFLSASPSASLEGVAREMSVMMASNSQKLPNHSMSEDSSVYRSRKTCFHSLTSDPTFYPGLASMCEHCEFHYRALSSTFEKFIAQHVMSGLPITEMDLREDSTGLNEPGPFNILPQNALTSPVRPNCSEVCASPTIPTPPVKSDSIPEVLSETLFQGQTSTAGRQQSVDSVCSVASGAFLEDITTDFLQKLKFYYQKQKQSEKEVVKEKELVCEKLSRTEEEFMELSIEKSECEKQLTLAQDKISQMEDSLSAAWAKNVQLNKEILGYKRQLLTEQCARGTSVLCKHYSRCAELENDKDRLTQQVQRTEEDNANLKSKIENLEQQIAILLAEKNCLSYGSLPTLKFI